MGTVTILPETTKDPISLIGRRAGICWGADISDPVKNYKRGLDCLESEHGRTLEFPDVELLLDGYSARVIREWYTHIGCLPTRLQASTRYINYKNPSYIIPPSIENNEFAKIRYINTMNMLFETLGALEDIGIPREDAANILPLGMTTRIVDKRNLRNYIDMSHQRMCNRALWEFRGLFSDIRKELREYSDEWKEIVDGYLIPKCEYRGFCTEKYSCGRKPKLDRAKQTNNGNV